MVGFGAQLVSADALPVLVSALMSKRAASSNQLPPSKRSKTQVSHTRIARTNDSRVNTHISHNRIARTNDNRVIKVREERLNSRGQSYVVNISPGKKRNRFTPATAKLPPVPKIWGPEDRDDLALDADPQGYDELVQSDVFLQQESLPKPKPRTEQSKRPNIYWKKKCLQIFVDELLRSKGRADAGTNGSCYHCGALAGIYRCKDCFLGCLACQECCVKQHQQNPLHIIEMWNGSFFERKSLESLGLAIQLNHQSMQCPNPTRCHRQLRVLHTNGIHKVNFMFCKCNITRPDYIQLLRRGFYPAPCTMATYRP
ncbi:hypothetical protein MPER_09474, partial [Moniliophthora perniciosa FA553]